MPPSFSEARRVEELFKYFEPASHAVGLHNIDSDQGYRPDLARLSSDPVLNALAQLGVHRLECNRAFVSLIDDHNQYVVAEVTRSISLVDTHRHAPGDGICIGTAVLDLHTGVCAGTMPAFQSATDEHFIATSNIYADRTRYVINDFMLEDTYRNRPYVSGFPHMRYYAEVPIRSKNGHTIGTYSVVDDKPHIGLSNDAHLVLTDIAGAIMRHLEMVKMVDGHEKSTRLLKGLNTFVGNDTNAVPEVLGNGLSSAASTAESDIGLSDHPSRPHYPNSTSNNSHSSGPSTDASSIGNSLTVDGDLRGSVTRAAMLLRKAMDLNGIVFLEPTKRRSSSRLMNSLLSSETRVTKASSGDSISFLPGGGGSVTSVATGKDSSDTKRAGITSTPVIPPPPTDEPCKTLGCSLKISNGSADNVMLPAEVTLPESLHKILLRHYPKGHIFNFGRIAVSSLRRKTDCPDGGLNGRRLILGQARTDARISRREAKESEIEAMIRVHLPQARSVIFMPLWNSNKETWFASCLGWTTQEKRLLQPEDFSFFRVFSNSIMAEVGRHELLATDRAKSDFISCISHELRSPLHGILGSSELLKEVVSDIEQLQLISMVESCGRTLLDTMNHILDYSKINSATRELKSSLLSTESANSDVGASGVFGEMSSFDLSVLVEEAVQSLVTGHQYNKFARSLDHLESLSRRTSTQTFDLDSTLQIEQGPIVILRIENCTSWTIKSETAAWRRCILNVLGNALKYTETGFIEVTLQRVNDVSSRSNDWATNTVALTVSDTGRGISESYLENHLFRPFVQENPLSSGAGLGLSIVKQLVDGLDGSLEFKSKEGSGTQVIIAVPDSATDLDGTLQTKQCLPNTAVMCLVGFDASTQAGLVRTPDAPVANRRISALQDALRTHAEQWLGMRSFTSPVVEGVQADLIVVHEETFQLLPENPKTVLDIKIPPKSSLLVICTQHSIRDQIRHTGSGQVQFLSQPFGPRQMKDVVAAALNRSQRSGRNDSPPPTKRLRMTPLDDAVDARIHQPVALISATPDATDAVLSHPSPAPTQPDTSQGQMPSVLLVDDNEVNMNLLVRCVQRLGINFSTAANGKQAVERYKSSNIAFDYVFMDISMPVMDGFEASRLIRSYEAAANRPATQIIAMTGLGSQEAQQKGSDSGMNLFWTKPVKLKKIKELILGST